MKITVYCKTGCPWAAAVRGFLDELDLRYELKNVSTQPEFARELEQRSGKCKSPSVEIDGEMVADASVEDVAKVLEKKGVDL